MPKTPKIHALTATLKVHIPVDPGNLDSLQQAADHTEHLLDLASAFGQASIETRLNRVPAPEPEQPADELDIPPPPRHGALMPDDLDIPDNLRRVPKPAAVE